MSKIDLTEVTQFIKQKNNSSYVENGVLNIKSEFATKADLIREVLPILREIVKTDDIESFDYVVYEDRHVNFLDYLESLITSEDKD